MKKKYAILNLIVVLAVIAWNGLSNTGVIGGKSVGDVSDKLYNLFTPAGYAFSIWGIIFLGMIANAIYQIKIAYKDKEEKQNNVLIIVPILSFQNIRWYSVQELYLLNPIALFIKFIFIGLFSA